MKQNVVYKCPKCQMAKKSAIAGAAIKCPKCDTSMSQTKTLNK